MNPSKFAFVVVALCFVSIAMTLTVPFSPEKFAFNVNTLGGSTYIAFAPNSTILGVTSPGSPSIPSNYDLLGSPEPIGINGLANVSGSSALQTFAYISPTTGQRVLRIFYQTTTGDIRSLYHTDPVFNPTFTPNPTFTLNPIFTIDSAIIISGGPILSKFAASCLTDDQNNFVMVIQYHDLMGNLLQRWSTSDSLNSVWSAPVTVVPNTTVSPFVTFNVNTVGGSTYIVSGIDSTIVAVASFASPSMPANYDLLGSVEPVGAIGLNNVFPSSQLASFTYISPTTQQRVIRIFYQTTASELRSLYHTDPDFSPTFTVDDTVIASDVVLATTISASCLIDAEGNFVMVVQYFSVNSTTGTGELVQRWSTSDTLNSVWSSPVTFASG